VGAWLILSTIPQVTLIQNRKGRVLGHTQANTNFRYVNANAETVRPAAAARVADLIFREKTEALSEDEKSS